MSALDLDLGPPIRAAILAQGPITALLGKYKAQPSIFTRRPVPAEAKDPIVLINDPASLVDSNSALSKDSPVIVIDVAIYGKKGAPGSTVDQTREVQEVGMLIRELFNRNRWALSPSGFHVIDVRAAGPVPAPVDDDKTIGRIVTLTVSLRRSA
jgi:hypothetical protein